MKFWEEGRQSKTFVQGAGHPKFTFLAGSGVFVKEANGVGLLRESVIEWCSSGKLSASLQPNAWAGLTVGSWVSRGPKWLSQRY